MTSRMPTPRSSSRRKWRTPCQHNRSSTMNSRKLAVVTGASSGIGLEIAKLAAKDGYDLIVAADTPFVEAGPALKNLGTEVQSIEADLATKQGVNQLLALIAERPVDVLVANA